MSPTLASTSFLSDSLSEGCPALPCSDGMPPLQFQMIGLGWVVFSFLYIWHDHLFCDRNATIDRGFAYLLGERGPQCHTSIETVVFVVMARNFFSFALLRI